MDQIVDKLAEHVGIDRETAHKAAGAVVSFLKERLPAPLAGKLDDYLPGADHAAGRYEAAASTEPAGLMGTLAGLAGTVLGGTKAGESSKLVEMLARSGLDMGQVQAFLPKALALLKDHVPPEVFAKIAEIGGVAGHAEKADRT